MVWMITIIGEWRLGSGGIVFCLDTVDLLIENNGLLNGEKK